MQEEGLGECRDSDSECERERGSAVEGVSELVNMGIWELRHPRHANRQTIYCATGFTGVWAAGGSTLRRRESVNHANEWAISEPKAKAAAEANKFIAFYKCQRRRRQRQRRRAPNDN